MSCIEEKYMNNIFEINVKLIKAMNSDELEKNFMIHYFHIIDDVIYIKIIHNNKKVFYNIKYNIEQQYLNIVQFFKNPSKKSTIKPIKNNFIEPKIEIIHKWCINIISIISELKKMVQLRDKLLIEKINYYINNGMETMKQISNMQPNNPENYIFKDDLKITLFEYKSLDDINIHFENETFELVMKTFGDIQLYPKFGYFYRVKKENTGFRKFRNKCSEKLMYLITLHIK